MFVPGSALLTDNLGFLSVTQAGAGESKLFGSKIGLIKAALSFTKDTTLAACAAVEADYNTYARWVAAPFTTVFVAEGGLYCIRSALKHVQMTDALAPNTIYGYFVTDVGETLFLGGEQFDEPIPLATVLDAFDHRWTFAQDPAANYGLALVG